MVLCDKHFCAGFVAGINGTVVSFPLDTIKTRLQSGCLDMDNARWRDIAKKSYVMNRYKFVSLFRGVASPVASVAPSQALVFYSKNKFMSVLKRPETAGNQFVAGMFAGAVQAIAYNPIEVIKIQMQVKEFRHKYKNSLHCFFKILNRYGPSAFGKGLLPAMARKVPSYGIYFGVYEMGNYVQGYDPTGHWSNLAKPFLSGGIAGTVSWYIMYPMDLVKTRIQAACLKSDTPAIMCTWNGMRADGELLDSFMLRNGAIKATLMRAFVNNAFCFGSYALVAHAWDTYNRK